MRSESSVLWLLWKSRSGRKVEKYAKSVIRRSAAACFYCQGLAGDPSLILADEPTGALDSKTSREVLNFLKQLNEEGNTIVMITHDNSIAMEAKRVVRIADGHKIFDGDVKDYAAIL